MNSDRPSRELGLPHLLLLLSIPLIPPFLSGILRAGLAEPLVTRTPLVDLPLSVGLAAGGFAAIAAVGWILSTWRWRSPRLSALAGTAVLLITGALLIWRCLYNQWFEGLVTVGGGDVGPHLLIRNFFLESPQIPKGAVTFYAVTHWAERAFGLDAFGSFRLAFYLTVAVVLLVIAVVAAQLGANSGSKSWAFLWLLFVVVSQIILFPLIHYLQADGFYSQLFALIPLFLCWAAYGLADYWVTRIAILMTWVVASRYTYGLNGGDILLSAFVLALFETRSQPSGLQRGVGWASALLFLAVTPVAYFQLFKYWNDAGKVVHPLVIPLLVGEALLTAVLALLPQLGRRAGISLGENGARLVRFACVVGAVNLVPPLVYSLTGEELPYYLQKYSFGAAALLASAAIVFLSFTVPGIVRPALQGPKPTARRLATVAAMFPVALLMLGAGYQPYLRTYVERLRPTPPWKRIGPLADRQGMERISAVLSSERKPFSGLLGSSWPLMHFENAALGENVLSATRNWEELADQAVKSRPGCLFWYGGSEEQVRLARRSEPGAARLRTRIAELETLPDKHCESYSAHWDPSRTLQLCHRCEGEISPAAGAQPVQPPGGSAGRSGVP